MNNEKGKSQIRLRSIPPETSLDVQETSFLGQKGKRTSLDKMKKMEGLYGFHLRLGGGEPAKLEWFGAQENAEEKREEEKEKIREPVIDIFDEKDRVVVIAELAGVNENDIKIETEANELRISANSADRKYTKTIKLPFNIKKKIKQRYKNGILELVFRK